MGEPAEQVVPGVLAELAEQVAQVVLAELEVRVGSAVLVVQVALAELAVPEASAEQVVPVELAIGRGAVQALVTGPEAAPELQIAQEVPVETDHPHDRLALPAKTRSATAAHHRGLAQVPAAEDLAAVVETTPAPAATEVVAAWVAGE